MSITTAPASLLPANEAERLAELYRLDVVDSPLGIELEPIVRLACKITGAGAAVVNLMDRDRQWQPCAIGLTPGETPREDSMCSHTVLSGETIHVRDATLDRRFVNSPYVDGRIGSVRMYASAPLVSDGLVVGTLCVVDETPFELDEGDLSALEDLAAQVVLTLRFRSDAAVLAHANRDLDAFAGTLAHDLRNPLASARGFAEILEEQVSADASKAPLANRLTNALVRMNDLIDDVLAYSRNTQGQQLLTNVDLGAVVQMAIENLDQLLSQSKASVRCAKLPSVHGDALQLTQVLQNLIANAVLHGNETSQVYVSAKTGGRWVTVMVDDNGPGVPTNQRDMIFEAFVRGDASGVRGTGLGLATCRRILERHHGRIWVNESPLLGGARFTLELPNTSLQPLR